MRFSANQPREGPGPRQAAPLPGPQQSSLYIAVADGRQGSGFRYTRPVLQSALQLMGCKPRNAFKISKRVFDVTRSDFVDTSKLDGSTTQEDGMNKQVAQ